jgi:hypothetical protein
MNFNHNIIASFGKDINYSARGAIGGSELGFGFGGAASSSFGGERSGFGGAASSSLGGVGFGGVASSGFGGLGSGSSSSFGGGAGSSFGGFGRGVSTAPPASQGSTAILILVESATQCLSLLSDAQVKNVVKEAKRRSELCLHFLSNAIGNPYEQILSL